MFVVIAVFRYSGDADTVSVSRTKEGAIKAWRNYMCHYDEPSGEDLDWLNANGDNLRNHGITDTQDSGTFYRLNHLPLSY